MNVVRLTGNDLADAIDTLAELRMSVLRDWPYLYDGDMAYERTYLQHYLTSPESVVIAAMAGDWIVGAATATPLSAHADEFGQAFADTDINVDRTFYCGESVLLPSYRGRGLGHVFFDQREAHARALGYSAMCFCAVQRPDDHPLAPADYTPLDGFWERRGYAPVPGAVARFRWRDVDTGTETEKPLQFWMRTL